MTTTRKLATGVATAALAFAVMSAAAHAQETTGAINGTAKGANGAAIPNAQVTVVYEPTNQTFTATTDAGGLFSVRQLPPGGPYRVTVTAPEGPISQEVPSVGLGAPFQLDIAPAAPETGVGEVVVRASRAGPRQAQTGPRSTFNATDVETLPSFSRDFKDLARLNPFVSLDPSNSNGLIIAGNNYRSSTIYVDGVRQSDDFGLNGNGYPTQRTPLSYDLVDQLNVEVAPYDVSYGQFTGGVLNLTTKSGSNTFHGSAYYEYDSDHLGAGQEIRDRFVTVPFQDKTYGFTLGGPIIKDHLFFEFGYEKYEGLSTSTLSGPVDGTGVVNQVAGVTTAQIQQIQQTLQQRYGFNPGAYGVSLPITDVKYFGKLTWQINDQHRLVFEAQSTDGQSYTSGSGTTSIALSSNGYVLDQPLTSYSGYLYSNWTPNFSTELSYTDRTVGRVPNVGVAGQPEYDIYLNGATTGPVVYAGTNYSYQANELTTESKLFRARANYTWGAHTFLAGYEHEDRSAEDLFIQRANGVYTFTSIANLQAGNAFQLQYANAADNSSASGVVPLDYTIHTFYLQDEWRLLSNLTLRVGFRDELYEQSGKPPANAFLANTFGINNTKNLDGLNTPMLRVGFNYRPISNLVISGGVGRFSGGSPDVYINNAFNGSGNILGSVTCSATNAATAACLNSLTNVTGVIPANVKAANTVSANAGTGVTAFLANNFTPPTVWKASLSAAYTLNFSELPWTGVAGRYLGDNWRIHGDFIYQYTDDGLILRDLDTERNVSGVAPDGRPIFNPNRGAGAVNLITRDDLELDSNGRGHSENWAVGVGKTFTNGIDFDVTYTHTRAYDQNPFTSSVAVSNYRSGGVAYTDPNNPELGISPYSIPYSVKANFGIEHKFFGDYATRLRVFAQRRGGLPYSYTYQLAYGSNGLDTTGFGLSTTSSQSQELLYVPKTDSTGNVTATSDPRVSYAFSGATSGTTVSGIGTQDLAGFNQFLKATGLIKYAGSIAPRGAFNSRDVTTVDLQFTQEIPAFFPTKAKAELYFSVFNFGNLLNNGWGILDQYAFPYAYQAVQATIIPCSTPGATCAAGQATQYRYTSYGQSGTRTPSVITTSSGNPPPSTWALKLGVRYKF